MKSDFGGKQGCGLAETQEGDSSQMYCGMGDCQIYKQQNRYVVREDMQGNASVQFHSDPQP
jgi:hypothetical protein